MVEWADEFEEYFINVQQRDEYEVKHRSNEKFQYFEELSKGTTKGGVAPTLEQNENLKHIVFDLLYQDKIKNWSLIRNLKYYDEDMHERLLHARNDNDQARAADYVEDALNDAKIRSREARLVGANARIETFVKWLENLPLSAFENENDIKPESLRRLLHALRLVERQAAPILGEAVN
jgi:hypothetical protein